MKEDEDQELPPRSTKLDFSHSATEDNRAPYNGADKAVKLRLVSLLGLLLLVIVAMKEAGKPERWMWMGFDRPSDPALVSDGEITDKDIVLEAESFAADTNAESELGEGVGYMPDRIARRLNESDDDLSTPHKSGADATDDQDPQQTPVAVDFWRATFLKLNESQQEAFYQLLRRIDAARLQPPKSDLPLDAVVARLTELQLNYQSRTLGELAVMLKGNRKNELTENLFAFDQSWQKHGLPALKASIAGDDFSMTDQATIRSIRSTIDPIVLKAVEDMTGMGNPRDKLAWRAIWDSVQRDAETVNSKNESETTLLQLKGQPHAFRGQTITVTGIARTIRHKVLKETLLNLDQYYELWIDPPSRVNDGLICVYVATLPDGIDSMMPEVTEKASKKASGKVSGNFQTVKFPVTVAGRFFKIRSYQDASKSVSHCPVVIAETFAADFGTRRSQSDAAAAKWQPSSQLTYAFLAIAALAAVGIAYAVFRSTNSGTQRADKPISKRVGRSLDALVDDETVMTDAQRVAELNKHLEEDFS